MAEPLAEMIFEPHVGGHIIDRGVNGAECRWATILVFDPPTKVVFSWDIDLDWQTQADPTKCSEVHVSFIAEGDGRTLVELDHCHLDRHGNGWEAMRDAVDSPKGWSLGPYAQALAHSARPDRLAPCWAPSRRATSPPGSPGSLRAKAG